MPNNRQKFNFYAVTHGKENGIYTSWTLAGDSVLGFAKAKFKGFCTYTEAAVAMSSAGYSDYSVFDGEHTYSKIDFEQSRGHQLCPLNTDSTVDTLTENNTSEISDTPDTNLETIPTVYIDGSCIRNGTSTAQAGYGIFWGDQHPWNCSNPLPLDSTATNNKAELMAAIKALQVATDNNLKRLIVCSDSNYVIQGVTEWIYKWSENGWKTANGEDVKNKDIWKELAAFAQDSGMDITWKHVAAHSGIPGNEEADKLALKAAKQIPVKTQIIEQRSGISSINSTSSINAKPATTKTQPKVIVIQKNNNSTTLNTTIQPEKVINTTPKRKSTKDRSETPVPGSMNGSYMSAQNLSASSQSDKLQGKMKSSIDINESVEKTQTMKIMTNMETVLQTVVAELHQIREEQIEFKKDIKQQIGDMQEKQEVVGKSVSNLSMEVSENIRSCILKIEKLEDNVKKERTVTSCYDEIKSTVLNLQKRVDSRLDTAKSSIQMLEASMSSAKSSMDQLSHDCTAEFQTLNSRNTQIQEAVSKMSTDIKKNGQSLMEVEKSLTSLAEKDEFTRPTKTAKVITSDVDCTTVTDNKYAELDDDSDDEVTFKGVEPAKRDSFKSKGSQVSEILPEKDTQDKLANHTKNNEKNVNTKTTENPDKQKTFTRREMVYLVGDSISGQVNQAMLGKATRTYVKKLKASKIDLHALTDQVKDAKMIIIHTGINNLREKDPTADRVKGLVQSVTSFKEAAPGSKVVVSKVIPIGDHEVDIDRNLFNAESEKKLTEINKTEISFIDHGNLADRGVPIQDYYRPDLVHLASNGISVFAENLEREIIRVLKKNEQRDDSGLSETLVPTNYNSSRNSNVFDQRSDRAERTFRPNNPTDNGNRQYTRQHDYSQGRDRRYGTDTGYRRPVHSRNHEFSRYPLRTDNRDNERQYYRNNTQINERRYYRNDSRDNERQYYRNSYNKENSGLDTKRYFNDINYSKDRYGERDYRYVRHRDFDDDYDYYGGRSGQF